MSTTRMDAIHAVLSGSPLPALSLTGEGSVVWANAPAEALLGRGTSELEGLDAAEVLLPARLRAEHRASLQRLMWTGDAGTTASHRGWGILDACGDERPADVHVARTGAEPPFVLFLQDSSEERALEQELHRTRGLLADARRLADVGTWEWDLVADRLVWSEECFAIAGRDPATWTPSIEAYLAVIHPDDRETVHEAVRRLVETPASYTFRARLVRPDGEERSVVVTQQPAAAVAGPPTRFFGIVRDVTGAEGSGGMPAKARSVHDALVQWEREGRGAQRLVQCLGSAFGWTAAALWLPDPRDDRIVLRAFWAEEGAELEELEDASRRGELVPGTGIAGRAWERAAPVLVADVSAEASFRRRGAAVRSGIVGAAAIPATDDGRVLAVLELFADDAQRVGRTDPELLAFAGVQVGAVLARAGRRLARPQLTPREREVLQLAAEGHGVGAVAERLVVSPATVKTHFQKVYDKLGVRDRAAAVAEGMRLGLVV